MPTSSVVYTHSLHDALPICSVRPHCGSYRHPDGSSRAWAPASGSPHGWHAPADRKSTRLNSSHQIISYAVFCLKKKDMMSYTYAALIRQPVLVLLVVLHSLS